MAKLPFTVTQGGDVVDVVEGFVRDAGRDPISYEDHFRESFEGAMRDEHGALRTTWMQRAIWIALRARHGERRTFDEWVDAIDNGDVEYVLGHAAEPVDPTGETTTRHDDASPVSPSAPDSTPTASPDSPTEATASTTRSSSKKPSRVASGSPSGATSPNTPR